MGNHARGHHHGDPRLRHAAHVFTSHVLKWAAGGAQFFSAGVGVLILASWIIVLVHLTELLVWAAFFLWQDAMPNASTSYYFALMQYTTVGSSFNLPLRWRLLDGMIPIAGLMTFAWSTGVLFTLAQEFQDQRMKLIEQRHKRRQHQAAGPPASADPENPEKG